jgi:hypothetical protein
MIRLILRRPAQLCGEATGFRTNYENIYPMDKIYADQVSDTLPLGEVSTITYANQQDGFLFREMSAHVKAEFGALLEINCRQEQHREWSSLGSKGKEEHPHMDGYTVGLEEGWFLTYAGELMYCRPIIVVGRDDTVCYSALSIDLVVEDQKRIAANRGDDDTNGTTGVTTHTTGYFLEPHTRRLTFWGTHMPCVLYFGGTYLNTRVRLGSGPSTSSAHGEAPDPEAARGAGIRPGETTEVRHRLWGIYDKALVRAMDQFT